MTTRPSATTRTRTSTALRLAAAGITALALAGCQTSPGSDDGTLSGSQLQDALLTVDDLPDGYAEQPSDDEPEDDSEEDDSAEDSEDDSASLGDDECLAALDEDSLVEQADPETAERGFAIEDNPTLSTVTQTVASYPSDVDVAGSFDDLATTLDGCSTLDFPSADGTSSFTGTIEHDEDAASDAVDDQINLSIELQNLAVMPFPEQIHMSAVRVGSDVITIATSGASPPKRDEQMEMVANAADRLSEVRDGS